MVTIILSAAPLGISGQETKKVLFIEKFAGLEIDSNSGVGYTHFADLLRDDGFLVAELDYNAVIYDKIEPYDVVVAVGASNLSKDAVSALTKYVANGGSLFVLYGGNDLLQIFGFSADNDFILDPLNTVGVVTMKLTGNSGWPCYFSLANC